MRYVCLVVFVLVFAQSVLHLINGGLGMAIGFTVALHQSALSKNVRSPRGAASEDVGDLPRE